MQKARGGHPRRHPQVEEAGRQAYLLGQSFLARDAGKLDNRIVGIFGCYMAERSQLEERKAKEGPETLAEFRCQYKKGLPDRVVCEPSIIYSFSPPSLRPHLKKNQGKPWATRSAQSSSSRNSTAARRSSSAGWTRRHGGSSR